jgi:hypothetical protein
MFMTGAVISPELTQAAYRLADRGPQSQSIAIGDPKNVITPVNPYLVIILVVLRRYMPSAGIGTILALMLPQEPGDPRVVDGTAPALDLAGRSPRAGGAVALPGAVSIGAEVGALR